MHGPMFPPALVFRYADYAAGGSAGVRPHIGMAGLASKFTVKEFGSGLCTWHLAGGLELFWDGGVATKREAAGGSGVPVMQSSATEPPLEEVAKRAPDAHKIFQLYVRGDDSFVDDYYKRSQKAGYAPQFCFTVDL